MKTNSQKFSSALLELQLIDYCMVVYCIFQTHSTKAINWAIASSVDHHSLTSSAAVTFSSYDDKTSNYSSLSMHVCMYMSMTCVLCTF